MKFRRIIVFSSGFAVGYLAGSAAGRERFEQISQRAAGIAEHLGLPGVSERLRERASDVARSSADLATTAASGVVDGTADRIEEGIASANARFSGNSETHMRSV